MHPRLTALALLAVAASLAAWGVCAQPAGAAVPPAPSGFEVGPRIADPTCNGGRGARLGIELGESPIVAAATMVDGSTLIAVSEIYPGKRTTTLHSVTQACALDVGFGRGGSARISIPVALLPSDAPAGGTPDNGLWVSLITARRSGGAIVAGTYGGAWVVGAVTRDGRLDPTFGVAGWTVLPFPGQVTAAVEEPSGRIVVAGDNGGGGCCTRNWAAALSAQGQLLRGFGSGGRVELPTGADSGVTGVLLEPNGSILVEVRYGRMGCWGTALSMLTHAGRPVPGFRARLDRFMRTLGIDTFAGSVAIAGDGFVLAGSGQSPCFGVRLADQPARSVGVMARFRADGRPAGGTVRYPSPMYGSVSVVPAGDDVFLVQRPYDPDTRITVTARRADGSLDRRFGTQGRATVHAPWSDSTDPYGIFVSAIAAGPAEILLIGRRSGVDQLRVMRVRLPAAGATSP